jgi:ABC-type Zn uptake system ZnuABC Zn-binding protein ZnuA
MMNDERTRTGFIGQHSSFTIPRREFIQMKRAFALLALVAGAAIFLGGCAGGSATDRDARLPDLKPARLASGAKLNVVATTGILGDVLANVGGQAIQLTTLIGPGQDLHSYQPTPQDIGAVEKSDVVFVNGFHLEEGLESTVDAVTAKGHPVVSISAGIPPRQPPAQGASAEKSQGVASEHAGGDPHVWFDPVLVKIWVRNAETSLKALDPANAAAYSANAATYLKQLDDLDAFIREQVSKVPPERRKLVTDHDAFGYFADRYGFTVVGAVIPGISTTAEPSAGDLAELVNRIRAEGVPAIFVGTSANPKMAEMVARETGAQVVRLSTGELGAKDSGTGTYLEMMKANTLALVDALTK